MVTIQDIIVAIEEFAPRDWQEPWDNAGVQVGCDLERECTGVLLTLDVSEVAVSEAVRAGANLIVSHHPLIFAELKAITEATPVERTVREAILNGIVVYSAHTNMDAAPGGVNGKLAEMLGLRDVEPLVPGLQRAERGRVGMGAIGSLPEAMEVERFLDRIKEVIGIPHLRHSALATKTVQRIALCGGNGTEFIGVALERGAELYLTSDIKYHQLFDAGAAGLLTLVDGGHYQTERHVVELFYALISKKFPTFAPRCTLTAQGSDPVRYY